MCRHRKVHRERSEKIRKEFINIFPVGVGGHAPPMMFNPRPNFFRPTTSHHFRTDPLVVIKRDFFHLKSWIVSCIEHQRAWKVEKKHQRKKEIYVKRWYFFSCFEKRQKKRKRERKEENNFSTFCASRNDYERKIPFISKTRQQRILWDSFNTGAVFSLGCLCCCLLMVAFFFSFILWFI